MTRVILLSVLTFVILGVVVYTVRNPSPMLIQYGTPEVPSNGAFAIMNPFRDRRPEDVAERMLQKMWSGNCESALIEEQVPGLDDVCGVVERSRNVRLIWRKDLERSSTLVYQFAQTNARLWFHLGRSGESYRVEAITSIR